MSTTASKADSRAGNTSTNWKWGYQDEPLLEPRK